MIRKFIVLALFFALVATVLPVEARTTLTLHEAEGDEIVSLGTARDRASGKIVEGYAIIHYKKGFGRASSRPSGGGAKNSCYSFLAQGAKWKTVEPWFVNATNTSGLSESFVASNLITDIAKWEDAADGIMGNGIGVDILGIGSTASSTLVADTVAPDGVNEVYFADVASPGAIAVTTVWGIFSGPISGRVLVEWDQVYDDVDFAWSTTGASSTMDFESIASHELGHTVGMGHPSDSCTEETMYRFASTGETKKRTLEAGDIAGINKLY